MSLRILNAFWLVILNQLWPILQRMLFPPFTFPGMTLYWLPFRRVAIIVIKASSSNTILIPLGFISKMFTISKETDLIPADVSSSIMLKWYLGSKKKGEPPITDDSFQYYDNSTQKTKSILEKFSR